MTYYVGDVVRMETVFKNRDGSLTDPAVTLTIEPPTAATIFIGTLTAGAITRVSVGVYRYDYTTTEPGAVMYTWAGTGAAFGSRLGTFRVETAAPTRLFQWSPAGDHMVVDNLEIVTLIQRDGATIRIPRALRLPGTVDLADAGSMSAYGNATQWIIWGADCPAAPQTNGALVDVYGNRFRINRVSHTVHSNCWEVETTADAGETF